MNIKRIIALVLAAILLLGLLAGILPNISAAEAYTVGLRTVSNQNTVTVESGEEVALYLYLANNPGIISVGVTLKCPEGISVLKTENAVTGGDFTPTWQFSASTASNPYLVWMLSPKKLVNYNGNIRKITFSVGENVATGDYTIHLSVPDDKNLTAETSGGVIKPNTNKKVTGLSAMDFIVTVTPSACQHQWGSWTTKQKATCETAGKEVRECAVCHNTQERVIDAIGHNVGPWTTVKAATCTQKGEEKRVCRNDGCTYSEKQEAAALGHNFGRAEVVREATATVPGLKRSKCSRCSAVDEQEIPCITEPTTEATKPSTQPTTEPTTEATKPSTQPTTEPTIETTKPSTQPTTEPTIETTKPSTQPTTEPTTEATKPSTQPTTEPTTETTKPTTQTTTAPTTVTTEPTTTTAETTTGASTEASTEGQTHPTSGETVATQPTQTQPDEGRDNKQVLYVVISIAGALLLGVIAAVIVMVTAEQRKKNKGQE